MRAVPTVLGRHVSVLCRTGSHEACNFASCCCACHLKTDARSLDPNVTTYTAQTQLTPQQLCDHINLKGGRKN